METGQYRGFAPIAAQYPQTSTEYVMSIFYHGRSTQIKTSKCRVPSHLIKKAQVYSTSFPSSINVLIYQDVPTNQKIQIYISYKQLNTIFRTKQSVKHKMGDDNPTDCNKTCILEQLQGMKQKLDQTRLILFILKDKVDPNNSTHRQTKILSGGSHCKLTQCCLNAVVILMQCCILVN